MRVIETEVYTFDELSDDAKERAIEKQRLYKMEMDISKWMIDDCYLLNPKGIDDLIIHNTRKLYYDLYRQYINVSEAMYIKDSAAFLNWLEIPIDLQDKIYYTIEESSIHFEENSVRVNFNDSDIDILDNAKDKFKEHCNYIFNSMKSSYDYYFSDECIIEDIEVNEYEFTKDGKLI